MSMELDGTQSPQDAIREEINKLRKEAGFTDDTSDDTTDVTTEPDHLDLSDDDTQFTTFDTTDDDDTVITPKEQTVDYWKHRFDVIQGKYNAETARMGEQINFLRGQMEELKSRPFESQQQSNQSVSEILDDLESEYGPEFTSAIDKRISRIVKEQVENAVGHLQQDLSSVKQSQAVSEQSMFEDVIDKLAPNWRSLNINPNFVSWVQANTETLSGLLFQDILIDAYNRRDAGKVAKIFNKYEEIKNKTARQTGVKAETSQLISPPKRGSSSHATIENNSGKVITQAQVQDFYQNLAQGVYAGKEAWVKSMKEEIMKANAEGRIV